MKSCASVISADLKSEDILVGKGKRSLSAKLANNLLINVLITPVSHDDRQICLHPFTYCYQTLIPRLPSVFARIFYFLRHWRDWPEVLRTRASLNLIQSRLCVFLFACFLANKIPHLRSIVSRFLLHKFAFSETGVRAKAVTRQISKIEAINFFSRRLFYALSDCKVNDAVRASLIYKV